jgi:hypothetical protein
VWVHARVVSRGKVARVGLDQLIERAAHGGRIARHARGVIPRVVGPIEGGRALRQIEGPLRGPARVLDVAGVARRHAEFRPRLRELGVELASALEEGIAPSSPLVARILLPMAYGRSASIDFVSAFTAGTSYFLSESAGSPSAFLSSVVASPTFGDDVFLLRR